MAETAVTPDSVFRRLGKPDVRSRDLPAVGVRGTIQASAPSISVAVREFESRQGACRMATVSVASSC
jgi:hypothetical protein